MYRLPSSPSSAALKLHRRRHRNFICNCRTSSGCVEGLEGDCWNEFGGLVDDFPMLEQSWIGAGLSCGEFQKLGKEERRQEDLMLMTLAKKSQWQRCPKCKFFVEKIDGCMLIKCRVDLVRQIPASSRPLMAAA